MTTDQSNGPKRGDYDNHDLRHEWRRLEPRDVSMRVVDQLLGALGTDIIVQAGGEVHGHPDGIHADAKVLRQSVEASMAGEKLAAYADDHPELATALGRWGAETPR